MVALSLGPELVVTDYTITPTHDVHHVTGDATHLSYINVPSPEFCGFVVLIIDSNVVIYGDGNIIFSGGSLTSDRATMFVYDPDEAKWYVNQAKN